jgi:hypothetical protein
MCPHTDDFYCFDVIQNLVNQPVLDIYPPGTCSGKVSQQFLIWWRGLVRIFFEDFE